MKAQLAHEAKRQGEVSPTRSFDLFPMRSKANRQQFQKKRRQVLLLSLHAQVWRTIQAEEANLLFAKTLEDIKLSSLALDAFEYFAASLYRNGGQTSEQEIQKLKAENKDRLDNA